MRRQDKYLESKFIPLQNYVDHIDEYFDILQAKNGVDHIPRNVFVATDEPDVITTLQKDYPRYNWLG